MTKMKWNYDWKVKKDTTMKKRAGRALYFSQLATEPGEPIRRILQLMIEEPARFHAQVEYQSGYGVHGYSVKDLVNQFEFSISVRDVEFEAPDSFSEYYEVVRTRSDSIAWATSSELLHLARGVSDMTHKKRLAEQQAADVRRQIELREGRDKTIALYNQ